MSADPIVKCGSYLLLHYNADLLHKTEFILRVHENSNNNNDNKNPQMPITSAGYVQMASENVRHEV